jgi:hypothetical protein
MNSTLISPVLSSIWAGEAQAADVLPPLCDSVNAYLADHGYTGAAMEMTAEATAEATTAP